MEDLDVQIGKKLREAREAAGYAIADVVHRAHLPRTVIEALEAEDFSVFTSPTYAKSFLNQYSEFLNVDAHMWLDALEPSSFVQTEGLHSVFETAPSIPKGNTPRIRKESRSTGFSSVLLMLITGGLLYAAYKGVEYMETMSGTADNGESAGKTIQPKPDLNGGSSPAAAKPVVSAAPAAHPVEPMVVKKQEEQLPSPPPRAIIVRD